MVKTYNKSSQAQANKIEQKKLEKLRSETNALQSSKNSILGAIWASQNHGFFEMLAIKMKMVFWPKKQERNNRPWTSHVRGRPKSPPELKL